MGDFNSARPPDDTKVPVHALTDQIYSIFGQEQVVLSKAAGQGRTMVFKVEVGTFRFKVGTGDTANDMAAPTETDVTAGAQSVQFAVADGLQYLSRPDELTIQGEGASDILTYWFI